MTRKEYLGIADALIKSKAPKNVVEAISYSLYKLNDRFSMNLFNHYVKGTLKDFDYEIR